MIGYLTPNYALISAFAPRAARRTRRESVALNRVFKAAPKLADFVREEETLTIKGTLDRPISGLAVDSRRVVPGSVFFALAGASPDEANSIDAAVSRGAVAIVTAQRLPLVPPARVTFVRVADVRAAMTGAAQRFYRFPDRDLNVIGVTGPAGKTTVAHWLKTFLEGDQPVGLLGTIHYDLGHRTVPAYRTTPAALDTIGLLAQMREAGCKHAVLELSAVALGRRELHGLNFGAVVFNNLAAEELENQAATLRAAPAGRARVAVVNLDDPLAPALLARLPAGQRTVTFGEHPRADIRIEAIVSGVERTRCRLVWPGGAMELEAPIIGRFNLANLLAAIATACALGRDPVVFLARLRALPGVAGRMERIAAGQPFAVFVDYAQTAAALRHALTALRAISPGRVHVVFGCDGGRHQDQRAAMTHTAQSLGDRVWATADNPRGEPLAKIFSEMRAGVTAPDRIAWEDDRRRAISLALAACAPGDSLLIAGKGHEQFQEGATTVAPFDDRQVVRELIRGGERPT
ncbi:MAG: UDP-N-acetylmuramoyl-L-alanyl-D-glutamate--2,6-diaminopimelate ligase [Verrucomicrobia bacterium]|nr:UDP-N-acetylmuramoyl-L-alanyl-D-glutamate--2,6-diaminopimelate ligase [Verrucomicrobiota bacterium]